jgi:hypothetical protein
MSWQPNFTIHDNLIVVHLTDSGYEGREVSFGCIVDLTLDDQVVGLEVLDICRQLQCAAITPTRLDKTFGWSYDPEVDASYFRLQSGRGLVQIKKQGTAIIGEAGDLVELRVPIERPTTSTNPG